MTMTVRRYELAYGGVVWAGVAVVALMFGFGAWMLSRSIRAGELSIVGMTVWVVWFLILLFVGFRTITSAREIVVHEGDDIEFVSALERQRIPARDIRSVKVLRSEYFQTVVNHSSGKVYLAGPMNDFHQFLSDLKQANPAVRSVGC